MVVEPGSTVVEPGSVETLLPVVDSAVVASEGSPPVAPLTLLPVVGSLFVVIAVVTVVLPLVSPAPDEDSVLPPVLAALVPGSVEQAAKRGMRHA